MTLGRRLPWVPIAVAGGLVGVALGWPRISHGTYTLGGVMPGGDACDSVEVDQVAIPSGDAGIYATVRVMRQLIQSAEVHPLVRLHAERAVAGVPSGDQ